MKKNNTLHALVFATIISTSWLSIQAMEPQDAAFQEQLSLIRAEYHQKWLHTQPQSEQQEQNSASQAEVSPVLKVMVPEENIVDLYINRFTDYQKTYGCLPPELKQMLARKVLETIPSLDASMQIKKSRSHLSECMGTYPAFTANKKNQDYGLMVCGCFNQSGNTLAYATENALHILEVVKNKSMFRNRLCIWHGMNKADIIDIQFIEGDSMIALFNSLGRGRAFSCNGKKKFEINNPKNGYTQAIARKAKKNEVIACMNQTCTQTTCTHDKRIHGLAERISNHAEKRDIVNFEYSEDSDLIHLIVKRSACRDALHHPYQILTCYLSTLKEIQYLNQPYNNTFSHALVVHHASNTLFVHDHWNAGEKLFFIDFSCLAEYDHFMRVRDLDQILCLALLFQLKKQHREFDPLAYPHIAQQLSSMPECIQKKFMMVIKEPKKNGCIIL